MVSVTPKTRKTVSLLQTARLFFFTGTLIAVLIVREPSSLNAEDDKTAETNDTEKFSFSAMKKVFSQVSPLTNLNC